MAEPDSNEDMKFVVEFLNRIIEKGTKQPNIQTEAKEAKRRLINSLEADNTALSKLSGYNEMMEEETQTLKAKLAVRDTGNISDAPRYNTKLQKEKQELEKQLTSEKIKVDELVDRLSSIASSNLSDGNPNIADLSDAFRPARLAEQFREMYDNEWTDAFTVIEKFTGKEKETIEILSKVIQQADDFCTNACDQQIENMVLWAVEEVINPKFKRNHDENPCVASKRAELDPSQAKAAGRTMKELQKTLAVVSVQPLAEIFERLYIASLVKQYDLDISEQLGKYMLKAVTLIWLMKVQRPPVELRWAAVNQEFDKNTFTFYTKQGTKVAQCIWPAVFLTANGPLISKGIAQGKE